MPSWFGRHTFSHGIHPPEFKELTREFPIRRFPFAPFLVLLLSQHAGKPARPIVRERQEVRRGQPLAEADGFVSAPIHAPAAGIIRKIGHALDTNGQMAPAIVLEPFPGSGQEVTWGRELDTEALTAKEIVAEIQAMGMVGLGGAAFPAHVKFSLPEGKRVDTVIINGCECEPYLTADHRVMLEQAGEVLLGTRLVARALGAERAVIAIEDNKPDAATVLNAALKTALENGEGGVDHKGISVQLLPTKYPQGAEKMLIKAILNREVPSGGLPSDVGVMVSNVTTVAEIGTLLPRGQGVIERVITITGPGVSRPGNYLIPVGTPLNFILEQVGLEHEAREVIFGGPMMGKSVTWLETPITKGVSGILVLADGKGAKPGKVYPCIRCGECLKACPMHLNPSMLGLLARGGAYDEMAAEYHLYDCFECGCCAYVCPSRLPLVQSYRVAKGVLRERSAA